MPPEQGRRWQSSLQINDMPGPWLQALVQEHLAATERLSLFQVNRGTAAVVLQHAPSIELLLSLGRSTARELHAQRQTIESILATAPTAQLKVCLTGCHSVSAFDVSTLASLWSGRIRQQVRQLTLKDIDITADMLQNQLQLQHCHQLNTLVLASACRLPSSIEQLKQLASQRTAIFPPSLHNLREEECNIRTSWCIAWIIGPQLTHLRCMNLSYHPECMLSQLTHVHVYTLDDSAMDHMMTLPHLTHVTAGWTQLIWSYASKQLRLHQLTLVTTAHLDQLLLLPLPSIQRLVLQGGITCKSIFSVKQVTAHLASSPNLQCDATTPFAISLNADTVQQATAHLASCPNLQCVPTREGYHLPGFPQFAVHMQHSSELATLCANSIAASGGLCVSGFELTDIQQLLPCIQSLPPKVNILHLILSSASEDMQQMTIGLHQLVAALPSHVKHLVIGVHGLATKVVSHQAHAIVHHLQDSQKSTQLIIALRPACEIPCELQALVTAHPGYVRCLHMNCGERHCW